MNSSDLEMALELRIERALHGIAALRGAARAAREEHADAIALAHAAHRAGAENLAHYLAVRRHDLRALQEELSRLGLSSLGRMEAHVMASLQAVHDVLLRLSGRAAAPAPEPASVSFASGHDLLRKHANAVLGACSPQRPTRIMVTMPSEAADDPELVRRMIDEGTSIARINCAHDDEPTWQRMVRNVRSAARALGRRCRISFDLAGPKLRTGPIASGDQVAKWRPVRDRQGQIVSAAQVRLRAAEGDAAALGGYIPVTGSLVGAARPGDVLELLDARGRRRRLSVTAVQAGECACEAESTAYAVPGLTLTLTRRGRPVAEGTIGPLPALEQSIVLRPGDRIEIWRGEEHGADAVRDHAGKLLRCARIGCSLPEVFAGARAAERIYFDDGRIGGVIRAASADRLEVEIVSAAGGAAKLRGEKGINLPDSELDLAALTAKDLQDLSFIARHGNLVALSFVQRPSDIEQLLGELARLHANRLGVVLKIETRRAFERLPALLFAAMRHPSIAVMVARGDLGVEVGFERLSEVQEEILWITEAAHVPVIWATQVLESLAQGGLPSRAEVTDAAMSSRAECVMLNKGPYIIDTLRFLVDVLTRMAEHQNKKSALLRKLRVSTPRSKPVARETDTGKRRGARGITPARATAGQSRARNARSTRATIETE